MTLNYKFLCLLVMSLFTLALKNSTGGDYPILNEILLETKSIDTRDWLRENYNGSSWFSALEKVSIGDKEGLLIINHFAGDLDAGIAHDVVIAFSKGLMLNPENLFRYTVPTFNVGVICRGPNVDAVGSYEEAMKEFKKTVDAISKINSPELLKIKKECLNELNKAPFELRGYYGID